MVDGILDLYVKEEILSQCETSFIEYLKVENDKSGGLSDENMDLIKGQLDALFEMMDAIIIKAGNEGVNEFEAYSTIVDQLIGYCIISKMNEARLCNVIAQLIEDKE